MLCALLQNHSLIDFGILFCRHCCLALTLLCYYLRIATLYYLHMLLWEVQRFLLFCAQLGLDIYLTGHVLLPLSFHNSCRILYRQLKGI